MSDSSARGITNSIQDVRLVSLASWSKAAEIEPRDRGGPYVVTQAGCSPDDFSMTADEFILGRSGKWLSLAHFYALPVDARREEFVFGTAGEVMKILGALTGKVRIFGPEEMPASGAPAPEAGTDEMATVIKAKGAGGAPA